MKPRIIPTSFSLLPQRLTAVCCMILLTWPVAARERMSTAAYIATYAQLAVREMNRSGVPASITLAQGILESDSGNSTLAIEANNHFGIKCKSDWTGSSVYHDDDAVGECFRKYSNVTESFKDHSDFLRSQQRYATLFTYKITDYKSWAIGLKAAGYATSPTYAERLIRIIEENKLMYYDNGDSPETTYRRSIFGKMRKQPITIDAIAKDPAFYVVIAKRKISKYNGTKYVMVKDNETMQQLAREIRKSPSALRRYNEVDKLYEPKGGERIYIQRKQVRAAKGITRHVVTSGESIRSIAQLYGMQSKALMRYNHISSQGTLRVGQELVLQPTKR